MSNDNNEPEYDVDAQFADIMSRWDTTATDEARGKGVNPAPRIHFSTGPDESAGSGSPHGSSGDPSPGSAADRTGPPGAGSADVAAPLEPAGGQDAGWRSYGVEDDDHFVPPAPRPLPAGDLQFWAILVGLVGGPALLIYVTVFNREASGFWTVLAVLASVAGFGLLVARMPARRDDTDGDDGARV